MASGDNESRKDSQDDSCTQAARGRVVRRVFGYGGLALAGALVLALGPNTFFYLEFQRKLTALAQDGQGGLLVARAAPGRARSESAWVRRQVDGFSLITPAGDLHDVRPLGDAGHVLSFTEGEARIDRFAPGSLAHIYRHEHEKVGAAGLVSTNDADVLRLASATALDDYRFLWSADERGDYAARLLTKLLLLEPGEVRRMEFSEDTRAGAAALLLEYADGAVKGFVVSPAQVWKLHLSAETPRASTLSPEDWLDAVRLEP